jgi:hypothetical protein
MEQCLYRTSARIFRVLETGFRNLQWKYDYIGLPKVTLTVLETLFSGIAMEIRLYRTSEHTVYVLDFVFQNLQWNCDYIDLEN